MIWKKVKKQLRDDLSDSVFDLWIDPIKSSSSSDGNINLSCPDRFFSAYITRNFFSLIKEKFVELDCGDINVTIGETEQDILPELDKNKQYRLPHLPAGNSSTRALHPAYTFDEFMLGSSNILAQSACKSIISDDDVVGPCLYISSATGLGKTHLTHAVAHQVLADSSMSRLQYLTAQQFSAEMVRSIKSNSMDVFKRKYHNQCDILLIEDIHTLAGKKKTQEELNEVLDLLIKSGKKVVLTAKGAPRELENVDDEIISRVSSGMVTAIQPPDVQTRRRIVTHKASRLNVDLDEEQVDYIARNLSGDIRQIESAVVNIRAKALLVGADIKLSLVEDVVGSMVQAAHMAPLTAKTISKLVGRQFDITIGELRSRSRKKKIAFPRQVAMYFGRKHTKESLADIGSVLNRDHSTVVHGIKVVTDLIRRDASVKAQMDIIDNKIKSI